MTDTERCATAGCPHPATVPGWFRNRWNPANDSRTIYCAECAAMLNRFRVFTPDPASTP